MRDGDQRRFWIPHLLSLIFNPKRDLGLHVAVLIAVAAAILFLWLTDVPLGVPGEWTWSRIRVPPGQFGEAALGFLLAALAAAAYIAFCSAGAKRLERASRWETALWVGGLSVVGFFWLGIVQESPPGEQHRLFKGPLVLYDPGASGYFYHARHHIHDVPSFLAHYEQWMSEGDVLHVGTHPPGLFLFHKAFIELCARSPGLTEVLLQTPPHSVEEAFRVIDEDVRPATSPLHGNAVFRLRRADQAALWLAVLITQLFAAATVIPLYLLLRRRISRPASWMAVVLWPLVPALAVFLPKSDALYPFLGTAFLVTWLEGYSRRSSLLCILAGLLFFGGLFFSLAFLPVGLLAALLTLWEAKRVQCPVSSVQSRRYGRQFSGPWTLDSGLWTLIRLSSLALGAFLTAVGLVWIVFDLNLLSVWAWNLRNHAAFYDQYPRTYWKWLLVNPCELAFAVGLPAVVLLIRGFYRAFTSAESWREPSLGPFWCCAIVGGLLWLSGKNMGEAARLWLVFMPWIIWLAGLSGERPLSLRDDAPPSLRGWVMVLLLQAAVCIATVTRVSGFPLLLTGS